MWVLTRITTLALQLTSINDGHFLKIKLHTCVFLSKHLGSFQTLSSPHYLTWLKNSSWQWRQRTPETLKGEAGGRGLNTSHLPPKTSVILGHWPTNKRLSQIHFALRLSALCGVFILEGHFSIGHGALKDPRTEIITVLLVALFMIVLLKQLQVLSWSFWRTNPFTGLKLREKVVCLVLYYCSLILMFLYS